MTTILALILIVLGVVEFVNNKRIAAVFDPFENDHHSTTRQNIVGISFAFIFAGLILLILP